MSKSPLVKRTGVIEEFTPDQVEEIRRCMFGHEHQSGPVYFITHYVRIQHPKRGDIPFLLYDFQVKMVDTFLTNNKTIVLASRQVGKSQTSAAFLLWFAMFNPDKTILIAANKNALAMEMIDRISFAYEFLPMWLKPGVTDDGWNKHTLRFENGSRIISTATSANSGRGMAISLLYLDEFAFVAPNIQDEFWTSILPTLSTGGACIMSSTPNGATDKFASIWRAANYETNMDGVMFVPIHVKWDEPPGRDEKFKQDHIAMLGELKFRQEYECVGGDTQLTVMDEAGSISTVTIQQLYDSL